MAGAMFTMLRKLVDDLARLPSSGTGETLQQLSRSKQEELAAFAFAVLYYQEKKQLLEKAWNKCFEQDTFTPEDNLSAQVQKYKLLIPRIMQCLFDSRGERSLGLYYENIPGHVRSDASADKRYKKLVEIIGKRVASSIYTPLTKFDLAELDELVTDQATKTAEEYTSIDYKSLKEVYDLRESGNVEACMADLGTKELISKDLEDVLEKVTKAKFSSGVIFLPTATKTTCISRPLSYSHTDDGARTSFAEAIKAIIEAAKQDQTDVELVVPVTVDNRHWIALKIVAPKAGKIQVEYVDGKGREIATDQFLFAMQTKLSAVLEVAVKINPTATVTRLEGYACGDWTIRQMLIWLQNVVPFSSDIQPITKSDAGAKDFLITIRRAILNLVGAAGAGFTKQLPRDIQGQAVSPSSTNTPSGGATPVTDSRNRPGSAFSFASNAGFSSLSGGVSSLDGRMVNRVLDYSSAPAQLSTVPSSPPLNPLTAMRKLEEATQREQMEVGGAIRNLPLINVNVENSLKAHQHLYQAFFASNSFRKTKLISDSERVVVNISGEIHCYSLLDQWQKDHAALLQLSKNITQCVQQLDSHARNQIQLAKDRYLVSLNDFTYRKFLTKTCPNFSRDNQNSIESLLFSRFIAAAEKGVALKWHAEFDDYNEELKKHYPVKEIGFHTECVEYSQDFEKTVEKMGALCNEHDAIINKLLQVKKPFQDLRASGLSLSDLEKMLYALKTHAAGRYSSFESKLEFLLSKLHKDVYSDQAGEVVGVISQILELPVEFSTEIIARIENSEAGFTFNEEVKEKFIACLRVKQREIELSEQQKRQEKEIIGYCRQLQQHTKLLLQWFIEVHEVAPADEKRDFEVRVGFLSEVNQNLETIDQLTSDKQIIRIKRIASVLKAFAENNTDINSSTFTLAVVRHTDNRMLPYKQQSEYFTEKAPAVMLLMDEILKPFIDVQRKLDASNKQELNIIERVKQACFYGINNDSWKELYIEFKNIIIELTPQIGILSSFFNRSQKALRDHAVSGIKALIKYLKIPMPNLSDLKNINVIGQELEKLEDLFVPPAEVLKPALETLGDKYCQQLEGIYKPVQAWLQTFTAAANELTEAIEAYKPQLEQPEGILDFYTQIDELRNQCGYLSDLLNQQQVFTVTGITNESGTTIINKMVEGLALQQQISPLDISKDFISVVAKLEKAINETNDQSQLLQQNFAQNPPVIMGVAKWYFGNKQKICDLQHDRGPIEDIFNLRQSMIEYDKKCEHETQKINEECELQCQAIQREIDELSQKMMSEKFDVERFPDSLLKILEKLKASSPESRTLELDDLRIREEALRIFDQGLFQVADESEEQIARNSQAYAKELRVIKSLRAFLESLELSLVGDSFFAWEELNDLDISFILGRDREAELAWWQNFDIDAHIKELEKETGLYFTLAAREKKVTELTRYKSSRIGQLGVEIRTLKEKGREQKCTITQDERLIFSEYIEMQVLYQIRKEEADVKINALKYQLLTHQAQAESEINEKQKFYEGKKAELLHSRLYEIGVNSYIVPSTEDMNQALDEKLRNFFASADNLDIQLSKEDQQACLRAAETPELLPSVCEFAQIAKNAEFNALLKKKLVARYSTQLQDIFGILQKDRHDNKAVIRELEKVQEGLQFFAYNLGVISQVDKVVNRDFAVIHEVIVLLIEGLKQQFLGYWQKSKDILDIKYSNPTRQKQVDRLIGAVTQILGKMQSGGCHLSILLKEMLSIQAEIQSEYSIFRSPEHSGLYQLVSKEVAILQDRNKAKLKEFKEVPEALLKHGNELLQVGLTHEQELGLSEQDYIAYFKLDNAPNMQTPKRRASSVLAFTSFAREELSKLENSYLEARQLKQQYDLESELYNCFESSIGDDADSKALIENATKLLDKVANKNGLSFVVEDLLMVMEQRGLSHLYSNGTLQACWQYLLNRVDQLTTFFSQQGSEDTNIQKEIQRIGDLQATIAEHVNLHLLKLLRRIQNNLSKDDADKTNLQTAQFILSGKFALDKDFVFPRGSINRNDIHVLMSIYDYLVRSKLKKDIELSDFKEHLVLFEKIAKQTWFATQQDIQSVEREFAVKYVIAILNNKDGIADITEILQGDALFRVGSLEMKGFALQAFIWERLIGEGVGLKDIHQGLIKAVAPYAIQQLDASPNIDWKIAYLLLRYGTPEQRSAVHEKILEKLNQLNDSNQLIKNFRNFYLDVVVNRINKEISDQIIQLERIIQECKLKEVSPPEDVCSKLEEARAKIIHVEKIIQGCKLKKFSSHWNELCIKLTDVDQLPEEKFNIARVIAEKIGDLDVKKIIENRNKAQKVERWLISVLQKNSCKATDFSDYIKLSPQGSLTSCIGFVCANVPNGGMVLKQVWLDKQKELDNDRNECLLTVLKKKIDSHTGKMNFTFEEVLLFSKERFSEQVNEIHDALKAAFAVPKDFSTDNTFITSGFESLAQSFGFQKFYATLRSDLNELLRQKDEKNLVKIFADKNIFRDVNYVVHLMLLHPVKKQELKHELNKIDVCFDNRHIAKAHPMRNILTIWRYVLEADIYECGKQLRQHEGLPKLEIAISHINLLYAFQKINAATSTEVAQLFEKFPCHVDCAQGDDEFRSSIEKACQALLDKVHNEESYDYANVSKIITAYGSLEQKVSLEEINQANKNIELLMEMLNDYKSDFYSEFPASREKAFILFKSFSKADKQHQTDFSADFLALLKNIILFAQTVRTEDNEKNDFVFEFALNNIGKIFDFLHENEIFYSIRSELQSACDISAQLLAQDLHPNSDKFKGNTEIGAANNLQGQDKRKLVADRVIFNALLIENFGSQGKKAKIYRAMQVLRDYHLSLYTGDNFGCEPDKKFRYSTVERLAKHFPEAMPDIAKLPKNRETRKIGDLVEAAKLNINKPIVNKLVTYLVNLLTPIKLNLIDDLIETKLNELCPEEKVRQEVIVLLMKNEIGLAQHKIFRREPLETDSERLGESWKKLNAVIALEDRLFRPNFINELDAFIKELKTRVDSDFESDLSIVKIFDEQQKKRIKLLLDAHENKELSDNNIKTEYLIEKFIKQGDFYSAAWELGTLLWANNNQYVFKPEFVQIIEQQLDKLCLEKNVSQLASLQKSSFLEVLAKSGMTFSTGEKANLYAQRIKNKIVSIQLKEQLMRLISYCKEALSESSLDQQYKKLIEVVNLAKSLSACDDFVLILQSSDIEESDIEKLADKLMTISSHFTPLSRKLKELLAKNKHEFFDKPMSSSAEIVDDIFKEVKKEFRLVAHYHVAEYRKNLHIHELLPPKEAIPAVLKLAPEKITPKFENLLRLSKEDALTFPGSLYLQSCLLDMLIKEQYLESVYQAIANDIISYVEGALTFDIKQLSAEDASVVGCFQGKRLQLSKLDVKLCLTTYLQSFCEAHPDINSYQEAKKYLSDAKAAKENKALVEAMSKLTKILKYVDGSDHVNKCEEAIFLLAQLNYAKACNQDLQAEPKNAFKQAKIISSLMATRNHIQAAVEVVLVNDGRIRSMLSDGRMLSMLKKHDALISGITKAFKHIELPLPADNESVYQEADRIGCMAVIKKSFQTDLNIVVANVVDNQQGLQKYVQQNYVQCRLPLVQSACEDLLKLFSKETLEKERFLRSQNSDSEQWEFGIADLELKKLTVGRVTGFVNFARFFLGVVCTGALALADLESLTKNLITLGEEFASRANENQLMRNIFLEWQRFIKSFSSMVIGHPTNAFYNENARYIFATYKLKNLYETFNISNEHELSRFMDKLDKWGSYLNPPICDELVLSSETLPKFVFYVEEALEKFKDSPFYEGMQKKWRDIFLKWYMQDNECAEFIKTNQSFFKREWSTLIADILNKANRGDKFANDMLIKAWLLKDKQTISLIAQSQLQDRANILIHLIKWSNCSSVEKTQAQLDFFYESFEVIQGKMKVLTEQLKVPSKLISPRQQSLMLEELCQLPSTLSKLTALAKEHDTAKFNEEGMEKKIGDFKQQIIQCIKDVDPTRVESLIDKHKLNDSWNKVPASPHPLRAGQGQTPDLLSLPEGLKEINSLTRQQ